MRAAGSAHGVPGSSQRGVDGRWARLEPPESGEDDGTLTTNDGISARRRLSARDVAHQRFSQGRDDCADTAKTDNDDGTTTTTTRQPPAAPEPARRVPRPSLAADGVGCPLARLAAAAGGCTAAGSCFCFLRLSHGGAARTSTRASDGLRLLGARSPRTRCLLSASLAMDAAPGYAQPRGPSLLDGAWRELGCPGPPRASACDAV